MFFKVQDWEPAIQSFVAGALFGRYREQTRRQRYMGLKHSAAIIEMQAAPQLHPDNFLRIFTLAQRAAAELVRNTQAGLMPANFRGLRPALKQDGRAPRLLESIVWASIFARELFGAFENRNPYLPVEEAESAHIDQCMQHVFSLRSVDGAGGTDGVVVIRHTTLNEVRIVTVTLVQLANLPVAAVESARVTARELTLHYGWRSTTDLDTQFQWNFRTIEDARDANDRDRPADAYYLVRELIGNALFGLQSAQRSIEHIDTVLDREIADALSQSSVTTGVFAFVYERWGSVTSASGLRPEFFFNDVRRKLKQVFTRVYEQYNLIDTRSRLRVENPDIVTAVTLGRALFLHYMEDDLPWANEPTNLALGVSRGELFVWLNTLYINLFVPLAKISCTTHINADRAQRQRSVITIEEALQQATIAATDDDDDDNNDAQARAKRTRTLALAKN